MKIKLSVKTRLIASIVGLVFIVCLVTGIAAYRETASELETAGKTDLEHLVAQGYQLCETHYQLSLEKAKNNLNVVKELFANAGGRVAEIKNNKMVLSGRGTDFVVNDNFYIVDRAKELVGGTATIFQVGNGTATRISTNVMKDGQRALGTTLSEPVYDKVVRQGQPYYGRAEFAGEWYIAAYEPIRNPSGQIIGVLYAGVKEKDLAMLREDMLGIKIAETGYLFCMDITGVLTVHPKSEGENISTHAFCKTMLAEAPKLGKETGWIKYKWDRNGKQAEKIVAYKYFPEWQWIVAAGSYMDEFTAPANNVAKMIIIISLLTIALGTIIGWFTALNITKPLGKAVNAIVEISKGNLSNRLNFNRSDEIGLLGSSMDKLSDAISGLLKDADNLSQSISVGRLDSRADSAKYEGDFKNLLDGFNGTLNTLVGYIDIIPNPVMIVDNEMNIQFMNQTGANIIGKSKQQLFGQKCYDQFKTSDCNTQKCACLRAMQDNRISTSETDAHPNGLNLDISYTGVPIKNEQGKTIGAMEFVVDQTAIKAAGRKIQKQADYQSREVGKLIENLGRVAKGNLEVDTTTAATDEDTKLVGENFAKINSSLAETVGAIQNLAADANTLAKAAVDGNLNVQVNLERHQGEYRKIVEAMDKTLTALSDILTEVALAADQVASAANEISSSSEQLSAGIKEQTNQTAQVSTAIEQMTATIVESSKNSSEAAEKAKEAASKSQEGSRLAENTSHGMDQIVNSSNVTAKNIEGLAVKATAIGEIIKVIDDIADQTNLLALNAAIEAARAGEQGRGFAVVADEVRKLAERTTKATKEVAETIKGIQADVTGANAQMADSQKIVVSGKELVQKTNASLNEIFTSIEAVQDMMRQIATASQQQSAAAEQISKNVENVNRITKESAQGAEQSAAAAEELNRQAEELRKRVAAFKLRKRQTVGV